MTTTAKTVKTVDTKKASKTVDTKKVAKKVSQKELTGNPVEQGRLAAKGDNIKAAEKASKKVAKLEGLGEQAQIIFKFLAKQKEPVTRTTISVKLGKVSASGRVMGGWVRKHIQPLIDQKLVKVEEDGKLKVA